MHIGIRIKEEIERRGTTVAEVSRTSGVSLRAVWSTIAGTTSPRAAAVVAIAKALGVEPGELMKGVTE